MGESEYISPADLSRLDNKQKVREQVTMAGADALKSLSKEKEEKPFPDEGAVNKKIDDTQGCRDLIESGESCNVSVDGRTLTVKLLGDRQIHIAIDLDDGPKFVPLRDIVADPDLIAKLPKKD